MDTESKCANCSKAISEPGHVYAAFYPALIIVLLFPGGRFCQPCANIFNAVGFFLTFLFGMGVIGWAFWSLAS